jgi:hypothetical protein
LVEHLARSTQFLLPVLNLPERCQLACDRLIDVIGRAAIETMLQLSVSQAEGFPAQHGKRCNKEGVEDHLQRDVCGRFHG